MRGRRRGPRWNQRAEGRYESYGINIVYVCIFSERPDDDVPKEIMDALKGDDISEDQDGFKNESDDRQQSYQNDSSRHYRDDSQGWERPSRRSEHFDNWQYSNKVVDRPSESYSYGRKTESISPSPSYYAAKKEDKRNERNERYDSGSTYRHSSSSTKRMPSSGVNEDPKKQKFDTYHNSGYNKSSYSSSSDMTSQGRSSTSSYGNWRSYSQDAKDEGGPYGRYERRDIHSDKNSSWHRGRSESGAANRKW